LKQFNINLKWLAWPVPDYNRLQVEGIPAEDG